MKGLVLWITGLPGSGKSTVAEGISARHRDFVVLRMDELRKIVTPEPTYSESEREAVYRCIIYIAKVLSELGHNVIIDATGSRKSWRTLARQIIRNFAEIFLKCSLEVCSERERLREETHGAPKDIYARGMSGWPVPGVHTPYEEPTAPEVAVNTDTVSLEETLSLILNFIERRLHG